MTKKNVIAQDPIGDGVGARKLKVRFSLSRTGHVHDRVSVCVSVCLCVIILVYTFLHFGIHFFTFWYTLFYILVYTFLSVYIFLIHQLITLIFGMHVP